MVLTVRHTTTYRYSSVVAFGEHLLMFRPRDDADQSTIEAEVRISPEPASFRENRDRYGNWFATATFAERAAELRFDSMVRLTYPRTGGSTRRSARLPWTWPRSDDKHGASDLTQWQARGFADPCGRIDEWVAALQQPDNPMEFLADLNGFVHRQVRYRRRIEKGIQTPAMTLELQSGSCRDLAVLMIDAARSLGYAARFVSGYIRIPAGLDRQYVGGGSTHAWAQILVPGGGWVDFDPTNNIIGNRDLVRVAVAPEPSEAIPLSGSWFGNPTDSVTMAVSVSVGSDESPQRPARRPTRRFGTAPLATV